MAGGTSRPEISTAISEDPGDDDISNARVVENDSKDGTDGTMARWRDSTMARCKGEEIGKIYQREGGGINKKEAIVGRSPGMPNLG